MAVLRRRTERPGPERRLHHSLWAIPQWRSLTTGFPSLSGAAAVWSGGVAFSKVTATDNGAIAGEHLAGVRYRHQCGIGTTWPGNGTLISPQLYTENCIDSSSTDGLPDDTVTGRDSARTRALPPVAQWLFFGITPVPRRNRVVFTLKRPGRQCSAVRLRWSPRRYSCRGKGRTPALGMRAGLSCRGAGESDAWMQNSGGKQASCGLCPATGQEKSGPVAEVVAACR